jgi:CBS domain containing-hemolysin-like protein
MTTVWIVVAVAVLLVSGFLSAAEAAVFSVSSSRIRTLVEEGFAGAEALARTRQRAPSLQTAVHLLITILNLLVMGAVVALGAERGGSSGALLAMAGGVVALVLFGEIVPRALAVRNPIRMGLRTAPLLLFLERMVGGILSPILRLEALIAGLHEDELHERELRELAELGRRQGVVDVDEHALVERAFRLDEMTAWDVMTPRVDIFAWRAELPLAEIVPTLPSVPHSRVPVYRDSIDEITGIVYVREAYETWVSGRREVTLGELARDPIFVPGSLSLAQLLRDFQARRIHMGIVADEYGGTDGLVTLEDVLEELVGEIVDETDLEEDDELQRIGKDDLVAEGQVDVREINYAFGVSLPLEENRSLNGFILDELGYVPEPGEALDVAGVRIEVLEATETQVLRARLNRLARDPDEDPDND